MALGENKSMSHLGIRIMVREVTHCMKNDTR